MTTEKSSSCWLGLSLIAIGGLALTLARGFADSGLGSNADPGPAAFPTILAFGLIAGGAWELVQSIRTGAWRGSLAGIRDRTLLQVLILVAGLVGYARLIGVVGFSLATIAFATILLIWLGTRWWIALIAAASLVVVVVSLFVWLFKVQLPSGMIGLPF